MENKTLHINLYAGPGTGKSTMAADIFSKLKYKNINAELITEYVKELVWEESFKKITNQIYLFAKQLKKHSTLENKVDVLITDSALPLGLIYDNGNTKYLKELILSEFNKFDNLNIFLKRTKKYNPNGRMQTELEAIEKDKEILSFLEENNIEYITIEATNTAYIEILNIIKKRRPNLWNNIQ